MILLLVGGFFIARYGMAKRTDLWAFLGSSLGVLGLVGLWAVGNYPSLIPALDNPELSLTVTNSSSSNLTLKVMLIIAVIGVPIVLAYTALVYRSFRGRLKSEAGGAHTRAMPRDHRILWNNRRHVLRRARSATLSCSHGGDKAVGKAIVA